jgi:hypothetical protein
MILHRFDIIILKKKFKNYIILIYLQIKNT